MNTLVQRWLMAALAGLCLCGGTPPVAAFSFDDMEKIDQAEQGELLEAAKLAAAAEDFARARALIGQARVKHYAPQAVAEAESTLRQAEAARDERVRREVQARLAREEAERRAREQANARTGGANCNAVATNGGLWQYCTSGSCNGFVRNDALWTLCERDSYAGYASNLWVWRYLEQGDVSGFAKDYPVWSAAQKQAGSFASRKRFIIYYMNGYIYE
ncbi:hypothetical protein [Azospirillum isscasi]|uniref:DUF4398 domain-containing protein n=1 Tax=Azospirillum isscasi TaxID=3053926 RepID=A0ABU0WQ66_9PROT|nr:hypothetical protein [Azospirillum isscasi]MDQ2106385.1 hypothetical protein [Azospirillum isscasi]